jgi:hypothetical protein
MGVGRPKLEGEMRFMYIFESHDGLGRRKQEES